MSPIYRTQEQVERSLSMSEELCGLGIARVDSDISEEEPEETFEFETSRFSDPNAIHHYVGKGKQVGDKNFTMFERASIGIVANLTGPSAAAREFEIPVRSAKNFKAGRINNKPNEELTNLVKPVVQRAHSKAADFLLKMLESAAGDDISDLTVKEKVRVASDLATVVERIAPKEQGAKDGNSPTVNFVVFAPRRNENLERFETIEVR